jgi:hypothetical protein
MKKTYDGKESDSIKYDRKRKDTRRREWKRTYDGKERE